MRHTARFCRLTQSPANLSHPSNSGRVIFLVDQVDKERLKALEDKIEAAKKASQGDDKPENHASAGEVGWRMVTELMAGIFIGFGIGYGLDSLFGTMPILLVLFTMFGFAAGIKTMMRTASDLQKNQAASAAKDERK